MVKYSAILLIIVGLSLAACSAEPTANEAACTAHLDSFQYFSDGDFDRYVAETEVLYLESQRADDPDLRELGQIINQSSKLWQETGYTNTELLGVVLNANDLYNSTCINLLDE